MSNEPKHTATPIETYSVFDKCSLTDIELIKKVSEWNTKLCDSGGKKWTLQVPPNVNEDPDLLIQELCLRFESLRAINAELIEALRATLPILNDVVHEQIDWVRIIVRTTLAKYEKP